MDKNTESIAQRTAAAVQPSARAKKARKPRPWPLKILLELIAIILCLALFVVTVAGGLMTDLRVLTSQGGIDKILTELLSPSLFAPAGAPWATPYAGRSAAFSSSGADPNTISGPLADMAYEYLSKMFGQDLPVSREQFAGFMEDSTVTEFISEKLSGAIKDFASDTNTTTITRQELMDLVRENAPLIQDTFGVSITEDHLQQIEGMLEEVPIMDTLEQEGLTGVLEESGLLGSGDGLTVGPVPEISEGLNAMKQVMQIIDQLSSNEALICVAGAALLLILLLFAVNGTVPKTLSDVGITLFFAGLLLSFVNILAAQGILQSLLGGHMAVLTVASGILSAVAPVHYSILGTGAALIVLAIVIKIIQAGHDTPKAAGNA